MTFPQNRNNPSREQLPALVEALRSLDKAKRREDADYRPRIVVDRTIAKDAVRDANFVLSILGMESESS